MLFTPHLFALNPAGQSQTLRKPALIGQGICVVPRGSCAFRRVRLAGSGREAKAAALLKARNEALPDQDGALVVPDKSGLVSEAGNTPAANDVVMAGIWGYPTSTEHLGRYLPETLAQLPLDNGARLVSGLSGVEGQIWREQNLVASRWWPQVPQEKDWNGFIRAAQESLGTLDFPLPAAVQVPWRNDLPVFDIDRERLMHVFSPVTIAGLAATALGCSALYFGAQYARETVVLQRVDSQSAILRLETEQIQSQRRRALANISYIQKYRQLGDNGTLLTALGGVAEVVGQSDLGIERAALRDGALELRLTGEEQLSVPDVVALLEARPTLSGVSVSLETLGVISIKADVASPSLVTQTAAAKNEQSNITAEEQP